MRQKPTVLLQREEESDVSQRAAMSCPAPLELVVLTRGAQHGGELEWAMEFSSNDAHFERAQSGFRCQTEPGCWGHIDTDTEGERGNCLLLTENICKKTGQR